MVKMNKRWRAKMVWWWIIAIARLHDAKLPSAVPQHLNTAPRLKIPTAGTT
jgi:hypothetical protein